MLVSESQYSNLRTSVKLDSSVLLMGLHCLLNFFSNGSLCEACNTVASIPSAQECSCSPILGAVNDADAQVPGLQKAKMKSVASSSSTYNDAVLIRAELRLKKSDS
jgi:hypothetical protein